MIQAAGQGGIQGQLPLLRVSDPFEESFHRRVAGVAHAIGGGGVACGQGGYQQGQATRQGQNFLHHRWLGNAFAGEELGRFFLAEGIEGQGGNQAVVVGPAVAIQRLPPRDDQHQVSGQGRDLAAQQVQQPLVEELARLLVGIEEQQQIRLFRHCPQPFHEQRRQHRFRFVHQPHVVFVLEFLRQVAGPFPRLVGQGIFIHQLFDCVSPHRHPLGQAQAGFGHGAPHQRRETLGRVGVGSNFLLFLAIVGVAVSKGFEVIALVGQLLRQVVHGRRQVGHAFIQIGASDGRFLILDDLLELPHQGSFTDAALSPNIEDQVGEVANLPFAHWIRQVPAKLLQLRFPPDEAGLLALPDNGLQAAARIVWGHGGEDSGNFSLFCQIAGSTTIPFPRYSQYHQSGRVRSAFTFGQGEALEVCRNAPSRKILQPDGYLSSG